MADIPNLDWFRSYKICQNLIGKEIRVDDSYDGILMGAYGGPLELFIMVAIDGHLKYIDLQNPLRIDILE